MADAVLDELRQHGHSVHVLDRAVWPEVALQVAHDVAEGRADQGVLFCWTGTA